MKKALILIFLVNCLALAGQSKLRLGINLDPMTSWLSPKTNNVDKDGARPGFGGGLLLEYYFHTNYGVISGLNLGVQGGNLKYDDAVSITTGKNSEVNLLPESSVAYSLSYLTLPIGLKLKTNEIGYFTYFAQLGFAQQINVGARGTSSGSGLNKDNIPKEINLLNMSYFFGGGVEYNVGGQTSLFAALIFNNGFVDVLSDDDHKAVQNFLTIRVGVLF